MTPRLTSWGLLGSNRGWGPVVPVSFLLHGPRLVLTPKAHLGSHKSLCTSRGFLLVAKIKVDITGVILGISVGSVGAAGLTQEVKGTFWR